MSLFDLAWYINYGNGSSTGYYAVTRWAANASVSAGAFRRQLATPTVGNERCFVALTSGTTGPSEPAWVLTRGGKTTDNTVTWQECTGVAAINGDITNSPTWTNFKGLAVTLGAVLYDSASGSIQICSTAGTAGSGSTPSFSATAGTTTADNTVTWTSLGAASTYTSAVWAYPHARLANAYAASWGAAGNTFFVSNNHAETQASAISLLPPGTLAAPCATYCVTSTAAPPTASNNTASITTTSGSITTPGNNNLYSYTYGVNFNSAASIFLGGSSFSVAGQNIFDACIFTLANTTSSSSIGFNGVDENCIFLYNCKCVLGATTQSMMGTGVSYGGTMIGGSIASTGSVPTTLFSISGSTKTAFIKLRDVDISSVTGTLVAVTNIYNGGIHFENCKLGAGVAISSGAFFNPTSSFIKLHNSDSSATNYRYLHATGVATVQQSTSVARSTGASNGSTSFSWQITTTANAGFTQPFVSEECTFWNNTVGSSVTVNIYLASNTALSNNQFWGEIEYPGASGSPLGSTVNGRMALLGTPAALPTDSSSSWTGSPANKYVCSLTFTPQMAGPLKLRFYAAVPSATIYVDPYVHIAGVGSMRQYFVPGGVMVNEGSNQGTVAPISMT